MRPVIVALLLTAVVGIEAGHSQSVLYGAVRQDSTRPMPRFTGRTLPHSHWAVDALDRARMLLLLPNWVPGQRAVSLDQVEAGLREAILAAEASNPEMLPLVQAWQTRLVEEFPGLASRDSAGAQLRLLQRTVAVAFETREGVAAPGFGEFEPERTGALPVEDRSVGIASAGLAATWSRHVSLSGDFEVDPDDFRVSRVEFAVGLGAWRASVGRGEVGYGHGVGGGVVLTGDAPLDAVQVGTRRALELPGVLRPLGRASFHTFLGRLDEDRHPDTPWFWGASLRVQPNRRFTLGVNRAAMFGGDEAVTLERLGSMLIGRVKGIGFENQIVTVSGRLILPTEGVVPLVAHLEWGAEDAAGSWWAVPGIVGGLTIPAIPGVSALSFTGEYAHFATSCCSNPSWYRHWSFNGAWASGDRTLGHRLGGNGSEINLSGSLDLERTRVRGEVFRRDRGVENLYSPERLGVSRGIGTRIEWAPRRAWQFRVEAGYEKGGSWSESRVRIGLHHF